MDPVTAWGLGVWLASYLAQISYQWMKVRAEVRHAELYHHGLSERIRFLPSGSRLSEKTGDSQVEITVGGVVAPHEEMRNE
ncbi:hypothetical protein [Streptomyces sp. 147326]|uniref:hypothetical protein n=1 Tax=Streptomyces sp. 147326 TaxID=3074379 RepID=UPI003857C173